MFPIVRLLKEHEDLLVASQALIDELNRSNSYARSEVGKMRARVAILLKEHLTSEHELLLSKLTPELRSQIPGYERVIQSTQDLRFAYSAHTGKWTSASASADWVGYRQATIELVSQLKRHAALEEQQLYKPAASLKRAA